MPLFSILTPSYGYGRFMSDCVRSVLAQDFRDVEHVVMDGASVDETVAVLRDSSSDARLRWTSEPDTGQSDALSKAFTVSTGEWIGWLNVDEFYLPGTLRAVADEIAGRPSADLIYGDFFEVDAGGHVLRLVAEHAHSASALRARCYIPSCTTFIRREAIPARLWDSACRSMMDWDLFLEIQRAGSIFSHIPKPLAAFRVHEDQVTAGVSAQSPAEFELIRRRHQIPTRGWRLAGVRALGRGSHIARKLVEGAYVREIRALHSRGTSLRWFDRLARAESSESGVDAA